MSIPNNDEVEGKLEQAKGTVKDKVGETIGDEEMETEGEMEQAEGEAQEKWGKVKRTVGDAAEAVKEAVTGDDN